MANSTISYDLPPLPSYTLTPRPLMIEGIPNSISQQLSTVLVYWGLSLFFHILDTYDLCSQYRLHTPAELLKRNHVSRYEVFRDVILQQLIQTFFGYLLGRLDPEEMMGKEEYDIAMWAQRLRMAQSYIPSLLAIFGVNSFALANKLAMSSSTWTSILSGGFYTFPGFATWEINAAKVIYWVGVPVIQFGVAIIFVDTWQYFIHRAMHMNKFLYTTLHSRHHRLYVPYAYGALYNHPVEGFFLDSLGAGLAYMLTGMTVRQGTWFFTCATIKTVDDHCGYAFPWDPLQHVTTNNAAYHDIHHQSWGIKANFSQPFSTFWDRVLGTAWTGGDISARYERDRLLAQKKVDADAKSMESFITNSPAIDLGRAARIAAASQKQVLEDKENGGFRIIEEERREEQEAKQSLRQNVRRRTSGFDPKSISDRVVGSLHGRSSAILHADGRH